MTLSPDTDPGVLDERLAEVRVGTPGRGGEGSSYRVPAIAVTPGVVTNVPVMTGVSSQ